MFLLIKNKKVSLFSSINKLKILIITAEDRNHSFIKIHDKNFKKYCAIHGYKYIRESNCPRSISTTYWCKIHLVKKYLDQDKYDYVVWADSDTIITNFKVPLEFFISKYNKDIIIGKDCTFNDSFIDINAGFFIVKNSIRGRSFINNCLETIRKKPKCIINNKEQGKWAGPCYEQGVMNELYRSDMYNNCIYVDNNKELIYNDCYKSYIKDLKKYKPHIVHLCGISNEKRTEFFKNYI